MACFHNAPRVRFNRLPSDQPKYFLDTQSMQDWPCAIWICGLSDLCWRMGNINVEEYYGILLKNIMEYVDRWLVSVTIPKWPNSWRWWIIVLYPELLVGYRWFLEYTRKQQFLVGGFKHFLVSISYMRCHPSYWRTHIFQRGRYTTNQSINGIWCHIPIIFCINDTSLIISLYNI